jgi:ABC-type Fe3+-siderophore transport system permease subunit
VWVSVLLASVINLVGPIFFVGLTLRSIYRFQLFQHYLDFLAIRR